MPRYPDAFESIAGICKFVATQKIDEEFYDKHSHAIEIANSFSRVLATNYPLLDAGFRQSLPLNTEEGGKVIKEAFENSNLDDNRLQWVDAQMTEVLKNLLPVVKDEDLPEMLNWSKAAIEGAFHNP